MTEENISVLKIRFLFKISAFAKRGIQSWTVGLSIATERNYTYLPIYLFFNLWLYSPCGPWPLFKFLNLYTDGRTPWTGDQSVARSLPIHGTTQTQNKAHRHPCL
jgi:hypothetical protein